MKATATIDASSLSEARKKADEAFREFFGESVYRITRESAESYLATMDGKVLSWRCDFEAEEGQ